MSLAQTASPAQTAPPADTAAPGRVAALGRVASDTRLVFLRSMRQTLRSKVAVVFGAVQPLLYLVLFGPLLSDLVDVRGFGAGSAWQVFVPGVLVQLALFGAGFAGFGLIADLRSGVVDRLRVTPASRTALLLGRVLRDTVVVAFQGAAVVAAGLALGLRAPVGGIAVGLLLVVALAVSVASLSYVVALRTRSEDAFAPILTSVTLPLMLLSGILLPMSLAPGWLDAVSRFTPFRYMVDAARAAFLGDYATAAVAEGALVAVVLLVASVALGARRFRRENA
ncbi:ABC transporter permease [Actinomadura mexicana]|uniref:Transport permease protein n=1 Tax=Actinomadura mexicana TaxID=134959 RepID=A0A239E609_9ACTN|nr:ABC transporter permease [Actinomadura mexicana]SNS40145.1 ABC-2 type transport system permease protein [Actinomadura mexicana]